MVISSLTGQPTQSPPDAKTLRPSEFWSEFGSGKELLVLRRVEDAAVSEDEKNIQGTWRIVKGPKYDSLGFKEGGEVVFSRRSFTSRSIMRNFKNQDGKPFQVWNELKLGYALDPTVTPKRIDIANIVSPGPMKPVHGIYELQGDQLTINWNWVSGGRGGNAPVSLQVPSKFTPDPNTQLIVLKRVKDKTGKGPGQAKSTIGAVFPDEKTIQGTWEIEGVSPVHNKPGDEKSGYRSPDRRFVEVELIKRRFVSGFRAAISRDEIRIEKPAGDRAGWQGSYRYALDPSKQPKTIRLDGDPGGDVSFPGIYELQRDRLTVCLGLPQPPLYLTEMPSKLVAGSHSILIVFKRLQSLPTTIKGMENVGGRQAAGPVVYRTAKVTRGDITATITATGTIEREEVVEVSAEVGGKIVSLGDDPRGEKDPRYKGKSVVCGTPVEKGTVLAQLDDESYKLRVMEAKIKHQSAEDEWNMQLDANKKVPGTVSQASIRKLQATQELEKIALQQAELALSRTRIRSPIRGVIIGRRVNVGQKVDDSTSLFSISIAKDLKKVQVRYLAGGRELIGQISGGMPFRLTADAVPGEVFLGKMEGMVPVIDNPDLKLTPGLPVKLQFEIVRKNVLRVPNAALRWMPLPHMTGYNLPGNDKTVRLWVEAPGGRSVHPIAVQIGPTDGTLTEVSGPDVKEGMEVVVGEEPSTGGYQRFPPAAHSAIAPIKSPAIVGGETSGSISLTEAIRVFNARAAQNPVGKDQPPLTQDEVIAAVRWALLHPDKLPVSDKTLQRLDNIIESRKLPQGFELEVITVFEPNDRMEVTKWSVRLRIPAKPYGTTCIMIRERVINSRLFGEEERKVIEKWRKNWEEQGGITSFDSPIYKKERSKAAEIDRSKEISDRQSKEDKPRWGRLASPGTSVVTPKSGKSPAINPAAELRALQGPWKVVRIEKGEVPDASRYGSWRSLDFNTRIPLSFQGQMFTVPQIEGNLKSLLYSINPLAGPKTMDLRKQQYSPEKRKLVALGIYKFEGDQLKICLAEYFPSLQTEQRPKHFAVEPRSADVLLTLERYRPSGDEKRMQGIWAFVNQIEDGKAMPEKELNDWLLHVSNAIAIFTNDNPFGNSFIQSNIAWICLLDPAKPRTITLVGREVSAFGQKKQEFHGIYRFDGDRLQIALRKGGPAPEKFQSTPGSDVTLLVLQRSKTKLASGPSGAEAGESPAKPKAN